MNNKKERYSYSISNEEEIQRYKKLWALFGDDTSAAEKIFYIDKPKFGNAPIIIDEEARTDLRIIYSAGCRQLVGKYIYSLTIFTTLGENQKKDDRVKWTDEKFGDVMIVDKNRFQPWINLHHESVNNLISNLILQFLNLSEASLRCLVRFLEKQHIQIPILRDDGTHAGVLKAKGNFNPYGKSLIGDFLSFGTEPKNLCNLWSETRNTIHNYYRYNPFGKEEDKTIEYKGAKYNFYPDYPLTFLTNDFYYMMIEDIYKLMINIFTHKKISQYKHIPGLDPVIR